MNRYILLLFLISLIARSSAFSQTPKTAEDFNNRGVSRRSQGDVDGAIEDFTKAISLKGLPITIAATTRKRWRLNRMMPESTMVADSCGRRAKI